MDIKKLSAKYNKAKVFSDGLKTPFFKELKKKLEYEIDLAMKAVVAEAIDNEHDRIVECRAYKKLLNFLESQETVYKRHEKALEEAGYKVSKVNKVS